MVYVLSIILGLVQALTEFLPISSSAHLILFRAWLDFDFVDGLTFDVALHVGTLLAVIVYFHRDIRDLITGFVTGITNRDPGNVSQRLVWYVIAACVPAAIAGLFLEDIIEIHLRNPAVIVVTLVLGGALFQLAEKFTSQQRVYEDMTLRSALVIGLAQTLALVPGVSRSGITIATGMVVRFKREEAARFSFLMSAPLLAGAGAKKAIDLSGHEMMDGEMAVLLAGVVTSALAGWFVIRMLLGILRRYGLGVFAWYRYALAAVVAVYLWVL